MPHRSCVLSSGEKVITKVLPATWKWKDTVPKLNEVNTSFGLKKISKYNVNKIRRRSFKEYEAKKPRDNFARCSSCDKYHSLRKLHQPGTQAALLVATKLQMHLNKAWAYRDLYAPNRYRSKCFPHECITIMHDKMDHAKTASPVFSHKTKQLDGLTKLPLSVTGTLLEHTKVQQFKFYIDAMEFSVMKYKLLYMDDDWLPRDGGIKLWKEDSQGQAQWPHGYPKAVKPSSMRNLEDIKRGLQGFINHWNKSSEEDSTGEYHRRYEPLSYYWQCVMVALDASTRFDETLKDGFWPTIRVAPSFEDEFTKTDNVWEEYDEDEHFVGQARDRPAESFRVNWDLYVAVRPSKDDAEHPFWIARVLSNPNSNLEYPGCVLIQYFQSVSHNRNMQKFYTSWDSRNGLRWKVDPANEEVWESTNSIFTTWKSGTKKDTSHCVMSIPPRQIEIIRRSLVVANKG